jgi:hypothetical protein
MREFSRLGNLPQVKESGLGYLTQVEDVSRLGYLPQVKLFLYYDTVFASG